ncbi:MAG: hypothetical protein K1X28_05885 [Parachlamydiales bacterium]|nr:hypothetical protein [Parachlamydiales bacterium]
MTTIDQNWLNLHRRQEQSFVPALLEYQKSTSGARTLLETAHKTIQLTSQAMPSAELKGAEALLGSSINILASTFIPTSTWDALTSLSNFGWNSIREFADAVLNYCSCASLFTENPLVGRISQVAEGSYDLSDLHLSYTDYCKASDLEGSANGEVKNVFTCTKNYYWLRTARAVASIAAMVLGLFLLAGAQWISGIAVITLSLTASLFSTLRDTHEISGKYPILKLDQPVQVLA